MASVEDLGDMNDEQIIPGELDRRLEEHIEAESCSFQVVVVEVEVDFRTRGINLDLCGYNLGTAPKIGRHELTNHL